jgi:hypothetical protein
MMTGQSDDDPSSSHIQEQEIEDISSSSGNNSDSDSQGSFQPTHQPIKILWDSSHHHNQPQSLPSFQGEAATLKDIGNQLLKSGDAHGSLKCYAEALEILSGNNNNDDEIAKLQSILYSNQAVAFSKLHQYTIALQSASQAHSLNPSWPKPLHHIARAYLHLNNPRAAVKACLDGEKLVPISSEGLSEFTALMEEAVVAAQWYDGIELEVRCAGDDAWLGGPAPHVPELDGPEDDDGDGGGGGGVYHLDQDTCHHPALLETQHQDVGSGALAVTTTISGTDASNTDALVSWNYSSKRRKTSFRSIKDAVAAARDGDRILLRSGIHNGMGESITIHKRVLIMGEGSLGDTVIDQRANCPTFRCVRGGVTIKNIDIDQTGFREAVLLEKGGVVLIDGCRIKCSGDVAVDIGDEAQPTLSHCIITAKKAGVRAFGSSKVKLTNCIIEKCGHQGVRAQESAVLSASHCLVQECEEEAALTMDTAKLALSNCTLRNNKGPGIDCSGAGEAVLKDTKVRDNVGGVWLWDASRVEMHHCELEGGPSHVVLVDGKKTKIEANQCVIKGSLHVTDAASRGLLSADTGNMFSDPDVPTDFPPESGPFIFVPSPYTRI